MRRNIVTKAQVIFGSMAMGLGFCSPNLSASPIDLAGVGYVQYGDGLSYSLPIAQYSLDGSTDKLHSGDEFYVEASEGQIKDLVVLGTDANGQSSTNAAGMDDAYDLPSGSGSATFFSTGTTSDPDPQLGDSDAFHNDFDDTWDVTLSALNNALAGDDMVVFFQNNQEGQQGPAAQSLAAWAQIWITDPNGTVVGDYFDFTNDGGQYALVSEGGGGNFLGDPSNYTNTVGRSDPAEDNGGTDYVLSGGEVCMHETLGIPVSCDDTNASAPLVHNISDNYASYAVVFPELNVLLNSLFENNVLDLDLYTMHVDYRLGCDPALYGDDANVQVCSGFDGDGNSVDWGKNLNAGGEKLWISSMYTPGRTVPEPATLALMGLGLVGIGYRRQRNKSSA